MNATTLKATVPPELRELNPDIDQQSIPAIARDSSSITRIRESIRDLATTHEVKLGDSRTTELSPSSVHLVLTSPPYWTLKEYPKREGQLGEVVDYKNFLECLRQVWQRCFEALVPGGRLICVVGDVCLSRRQNGGRHCVIPLHADILKQCVSIGFDNLAPIIWYKIANMETESCSVGRTSYLGKPFEPNGILKNEIEFILMLRKPGGYRSPSQAARLLSVISRDEHNLWFRQIWSDIQGESTKEHPAPYPVKLADRLIRMFSFVGDTVFDPFTGTATTQFAAMQCGRNSIGIEIEPTYHSAAKTRLDGDIFTRRS
ncbi:MAG: site-specific DNA-methyltransferase [Gammaproteobacteria bacterium]|nr:site-specific DNA-methyltransferase [Gammaproteobacteria bacterium]